MDRIKFRKILNENSLYNAKGELLWVGKSVSKGYGKFSAEGKSYLAHRVSWELMFGEIPKGICVLHRNDNPPDINPFNLFLGSRADNHRDAVRKGRHARGMMLAKKLTDRDILEIRDDYENGKTIIKIAQEKDVSKMTISKIINFKMWTYIEVDK